MPRLLPAISGEDDDRHDTKDRHRYRRRLRIAEIDRTPLTPAPADISTTAAAAKTAAASTAAAATSTAAAAASTASGQDQRRACLLRRSSGDITTHAAAPGNWGGGRLGSRQTDQRDRRQVKQILLHRRGLARCIWPEFASSLGLLGGQ